MTSIEQLVDQVIAAFKIKRRTHWQLTPLNCPGDEQQLAQWQDLVKRRMETLQQDGVDRDVLLERVRRRFDPVWKASFTGVADELQVMAREDLRVHLVAHGMPDELADKLVSGHYIGAMLQYP